MAQFRRVTIGDVARLASVAPSTVSKAMNGTGQLREETRRRVLAAAAELGFVPDGLGRSLASGRTYTVAILTGDLTGRFSIPVLLGAENALSADQFLVLLCDSRDDPLREQHYLRHLVARRVEGIIVTGRRTEARAHVDVPMPVVYAFAQSELEQDASVVVNDALGAERVHEHLTTLGRRRIAHITGPSNQRSARGRAEATSAAAAAAGAPLACPPLYGDWSEAWGRAAVDVLLDRYAASVDAISCGNDIIARGVESRLRERGLRIPDDVAVAGFDDWDVMVAGATPPLTSVALELDRVGRRAAEMLLDAIGGHPHSGVESITPRLVARASTLGGP
jgi:LacI family transcriptional regulator